MLTRDFPNLPCTVRATLRPISVLPVKDISLMRLSADMLWPTSVPPWQRADTPPGRPFFSKTSATILLTKRWVNFFKPKGPNFYLKMPKYLWHFQCSISYRPCCQNFHKNYAKNDGVFNVQFYNTNLV